MLLCEYGKDIAVYALIIVTIGWFDRHFPPTGHREKPSLPLRGGEGLGEVGRAAPRRQLIVRNACTHSRMS